MGTEEAQDSERMGFLPLAAHPQGFCAEFWGGLYGFGVFSGIEALSCGKTCPLQPYSGYRAPASPGVPCSSAEMES